MEFQSCGDGLLNLVIENLDDDYFAKTRCAALRALTCFAQLFESNILREPHVLQNIADCLDDADSMVCPSAASSKRSNRKKGLCGITAHAHAHRLVLGMMTVYKAITPLVPYHFTLTEQELCCLVFKMCRLCRDGMETPYL
jgi:hypothetical protein